MINERKRGILCNIKLCQINIKYLKMSSGRGLLG
jgi:hypothetical protein